MTTERKSDNWLFLLLQPRQPLPGILELGKAGVAVFPRGVEFLEFLRPAARAADLVAATAGEWS